MSGDKNFVKEIEFINGRPVIFGDGSKSTVEEKGNIKIFGLPILQNVLFVNGLKANLLSFIQFCDNNFFVEFSKDECNVYNQAGEWIL